MTYPPKPRRLIRRLVGATALGAMALAAGAETPATLNLFGATGLIDMPSGEPQPDATFSVTSGHFGPMSRTTLTFQISPRLSGSFRYSAIRNYARLFCPPDCRGVNEFPTYYDRSFDLRYLIADEGRYLPALTIGLQDFVGTGRLSGEYIAATKHVTPRVKVTAGLGWGYLGTYGEIGAPFGERPIRDRGLEGQANFSQWFRGDMAPFGGIEWQINDTWGLKAEYSSIGYPEESDRRQTFERRSPFNFGVEYQRGNNMRFGAYYMYGSEIGFAAHILLNADQRRSGGMGGPAPDPVAPRPSRAADPDAWSPEWVTQDGAQEVLIANLNKRLERDGLRVEAMGYTATRTQVRVRNLSYDAEAQAIGRVARTMSQVMPASVEVFEIVPVVNGVPMSKVTVRRSDLEALEFSTDQAAAMRARVKIEDPGRPIAGLVFDKAAYPKFNWSVTPYLRFRLFDLDNPVRADLGLRVGASYEIRPGLMLAGSLTKKIAGTLNEPPPNIVAALQPVRSDVDRYDALGDPALESLTLAWFGRVAPEVYGRVTVGYLERMFGGISTELLWKPVGKRWAIGAEVNYVGQRDPDQGFGFSFYDYKVATGHVSGYLELGKGYHAQLDVGHYLAGDVGATLTLDREFENGWKVGAFATLTDVSPEDFGSGTFDKGIRVEIPIAWFTGQPTRAARPLTLRPFGRDGGARLEVDGRLYETVRDYQTSGLDAQWGRFWK